MASEVDIVNMAIARLGSAQRVSSIDPPDGSALAASASTFYPMVRDSMLEMKEWPFAVTRAALSQLADITIPPPYTHAYAMPSAAIVPISIRHADAPDNSKPNLLSWEMSNDGSTRIVFTDTEEAVMRYKIGATDPSKFTPLFVDALAWGLSIQLAGTVMGGDLKRTDYCTRMFMHTLGLVTDTVFGSLNTPVEHLPSSLAAR